jgi:hypothetical protein
MRHEFNDSQRNDPELREKVTKVLTAQNELLYEAARVLKALSTEMRKLDLQTNPIYDRCAHTVAIAANSVGSDSDFMNRSPINDTYVGNMAAGEMGDYLKSIDFEKRFEGVL